ncbi:hypothetical protein N8I84_24720 [Streptomyces cynarae]|uniref:Uncharacterized protein n=1 Tax=Streptomyces cynarae TaxID=2981134 RepID=A0ABY6E4E7_9ACTN|nr:hypothetical protein [Streptomyces cynarae]UXY21534.1 hypothetical protein N8I84_24720 [Streptomyces cynarae]
MGERHNDGQVFGRRRVHPRGTASVPADAAGSAALEALLAAALREGALDAEAEQRAVAAFRAVRDAGAPQARTRRRDDWRPLGHRRVRSSVKATVCLFLAGLTLSGVAFAAIGPGGSFGGGDSGGHGRRQPSPGASDRWSGAPDSATSHVPNASVSPDRPDTAQDTEAHCRAYEQVKNRGNAIGSTAWQRLVEAAGGEQNVAVYCAEQLAQDDGNSGKSDQSGKAEKAGRAPAASRTPEPGEQTEKADKGRGKTK